MKNRVLTVWLVPILLLMQWNVSADNPPNGFRSDDLRAGMTGYTLSCFHGSEPIKLDVEILGVLHNQRPASNRIIARVSGEPVDHAGIMAGMSGSPVFIHNRLIGAIAYAFPFAKEPICGITPIEDMNLLLEKMPIGSANISYSTTKFTNLIDNPFRSQNHQMQLIQTPLVLAGVPDSCIDLLANTDFTRDFFSHHIPISGGVSGISNLSENRLKPGGPIGTIMIDGDIKMAASGTVTDVRGDRILAYGHSMFNLGKCNVPMALSEIVTFIPNLANSFKLSNIGPVVGSITFDSVSGVAGTIDYIPKLIPVDVLIKHAGTTTSYSFEIIDNKHMTGTFSAIGTGLALSFLGPNSGDFSYVLDIVIEINNYSPLKIHRVFGKSANALETAFRSLNIVTNLMNNPVEDISIRKLTVQAEISEHLEYARLESARLVKKVCKPGDTLPVCLTIKEYRAPAVQRIVYLPIPGKINPGDYLVKILDAQRYSQILSSKHLSTFHNRAFSDYLAVLQEQGSEDTLYILLTQPSKDIYLGHTVLHNAPLTMESIMLSGESSTDIKQSFSIVSKTTETFPYQITGQHECRIQIDAGTASD